MLPPYYFRLAVARFVLGIASSEDLIQASDSLLADGIYSHSLGEVATSCEPRSEEVAPRFASALRELAISVPTKNEARDILLKAHMREIAEGTPSPRGALRALKDLSDSLGIKPLPKWNDLIHWLWESADTPSLVRAGYIDGAEGEQRLAELDRLTVTFAVGWLREQTPVFVDPLWLTWNGGTVPRLAQTIRDERRYSDLPILADALQDAGCADDEVLDHCRSGAKHRHGCWVVDLLLTVR
jgi:hypothetical protein